MTVTSISRLKKLNKFLWKDRIYCINWLIPIHIFLYIFIHMNCCCCCLVAKLCPSLCDPMNGSRLGFAVLQCLPEFGRTHVHWVSDAIPTISSSVAPFCSCPQSFPASLSFPVSQLFASGGQSIGASASAKVLPDLGLISFGNDWFDLVVHMNTYIICSYIPVHSYEYIHRFIWSC